MTSPTAPTPLPDLEPAAGLLVRVLAGVRDDQLGDPTPCANYPVRDVLRHVFALSAALRDAARKLPSAVRFEDPTAVLADLDTVGADWRTGLPALLDELTAAWREPAAWEGSTEAGGLPFGAAQAGCVAFSELVVHGWDLARATGQDYAPDAVVLEAAAGILAMLPQERPPGGTFAPVVEVAPDAPLLDRLIGLTGRDPSWTPSR